MIDDIASFSLCGPESMITNAIINAKIESKKLEFGPSKCFNLHIGESKSSCAEVKVHNNSMNKKDHETYLRDVICASGKNNKNIENKRNCGVGTVSQIISMLGQISLGHHHFEIGLILRDSMLVSRLVNSSEIWYNITKEQYRKLEEIDEMYLMRLFNVPKSVPRLSLYAECGKLPLRFIIRTRRLLYLWHILHLDESELVYKFYLAQKLRPSKNDWSCQITQDKKDLNLNLSDEEIMKMSKPKFKKILQIKTNSCAAKYFLKIQSKQTKTAHLMISDDFKPAMYLSSKML